MPVTSQLCTQSRVLNVIPPNRQERRGERLNNTPRFRLIASPPLAPAGFSYPVILEILSCIALGLLDLLFLGRLLPRFDAGDKTRVRATLATPGAILIARLGA